LTIDADEHVALSDACEITSRSRNDFLRGHPFGKLRPEDSVLDFGLPARAEPDVLDPESGQDKHDGDGEGRAPGKPPIG
jgi:hypothetical protein